MIAKLAILKTKGDDIVKGNYKLYKLRVAKTGIVFGVNKFGHRWIEFWLKGKLIKQITTVKPYHERVLDAYRAEDFEYQLKEVYWYDLLNYHNKSYA